MSSTIITIIRHGQVHNPQSVVYGRLPGFGLSDFGKRQVESASLHCQRMNFTALYSSPMLRARETAEIIGYYHPHLEVNIAEAINEVVFKFEGEPMDNLSSRGWDLYTGVGSGYEQPGDIILRVKPFLDTLRERHQNEHIALVTHGDVIAFTILWISGRELTPKNKHTLDTLGFEDDYPAPASLTHLTYSTIDPDEKPLINYVKPYDAFLDDRGVSPR
ncbi:MAG: histidine phosphatase family protein [Anaerolineae bacterium]|nr:histidine phosphatase family protein [Anaerolineae bacterium]